MQVQNGIEVYDDNERPPIPKGLSVGIQVYSPYGFKTIEVDGVTMWALATEEDYRNLEAKRLGISPGEVAAKSSDPNSKDCAMSGPNGPCIGYCGVGCQCRFVFNPATGVSSCVPFHW
jgi:hypothetical protein